MIDGMEGDRLRLAIVNASAARRLGGTGMQAVLLVRRGMSVVGYESTASTEDDQTDTYNDFRGHYRGGPIISSRRLPSLLGDLVSHD